MIYYIIYLSEDNVSKLEKLLIKLYSHPRTFDFKDAKTLLHELDYQLDNKGKRVDLELFLKRAVIGSFFINHILEKNYYHIKSNKFKIKSKR